MPISVIAAEAATATVASPASGIHRAASHHSRIVNAAAHVPGPGWRCPTPKNVARSQETRDLEVTFVVNNISPWMMIHLQEGVLDLKFSKSLAVLEIFCV